MGGWAGAWVRGRGTALRQVSKPDFALRCFYWAALLSPALVPLLVRYLPFQDWPGHLGLVGVLVHWDDPRFTMPAEYFSRGWVGPNRLFYVLSWPFGEAFGPVTGARILLALFLGALGPSVHGLVRALGGDPRVALLVPPLALGRHLLCGFAPNAAALPFFVLSLAAFARARRRPSAGAWVLVFVLGLATLGLHVFVFLVLAGLLSLSALVEVGRRQWGVAAATAGTLALFAPFVAWLGRPAASSSGSGTIRALFDAIDLPTWSKASAAWTWLFASYHESVTDDAIQALWASVFVTGAMAGWVALGRRARSRPGEGDRHVDAVHLGTWFAATAVVFLGFEEYVGPPVNWWGGSLRLPVLAALFATAGLGFLVPAVTKRVRGALLYASAFTSVAFVAFVVATTKRFERTEMAGFDDVVEAIPYGASVCPLHHGSEVTADFPGVAHGYVGNYVVARRGGRIPQGVFGNEGVLFGARVGIVQPGWGQLSGFRWSRHHRDCDYFLVRIDAGEVWSEEHRGRVKRVATSSTWSLYEQPVD